MSTISDYLGILDASIGVLIPIFKFAFLLLIPVLFIVLMFGAIKMIKWITG